MTINDLIEELEIARDELGSQAEVRVAYQRHYPLRGTVAAVTVPPPEDEPYAEGDQAAGQEGDEAMVWLALGDAPYAENPYGPAWAWGER